MAEDTYAPERMEAIRQGTAIQGARERQGDDGLKICFVLHLYTAEEGIYEALDGILGGREAEALRRCD